MAWVCRAATWLFRVSRRGGCSVSRTRGSGQAEIDGAVSDVKDDRRRTTADRRERMGRGGTREKKETRKDPKTFGVFAQQGTLS
jgi:hypothetical protein